MRLERDQHGTRRAMLLSRATPFEKGLITVVNKVQLRLVFIVPADTVTYRSCPSVTPFSPFHWLPRFPLWSYVLFFFFLLLLLFTGLRVLMEWS